ncbi:hypothetical protein C2G38_2215973 [Gigaspora rosea]|uniref:Serine-threonine/tyrosine-protein kinase catalytic domain-containing protein n=1 Tax=Gigaspora rosea TaxID=44941 RepID=A0A397U9A8_9GLOM|nr:hypothetical protein C2G38_2215973 [Gigaspora rosea]
MNFFSKHISVQEASIMHSFSQLDNIKSNTSEDISYTIVHKFPGDPDQQDFQMRKKAPNCYIELVKQCINIDPEKRPNAMIVLNKIEN